MSLIKFIKNRWFLATVSLIPLVAMEAIQYKQQKQKLASETTAIVTPFSSAPTKKPINDTQRTTPIVTGNIDPHTQ